MRKNQFYAIFVCLMLTSCALLVRSVNVEISGNYNKLTFKSYAILPFIDKRTKLKKLQQNTGYLPADAMTDAFETAFIGTGSKVVERRNIDSALNELRFSHAGDVNTDQLKEIGRLTNSDVIIMGKVRQFQNAEFNHSEKPDKPTKCTTISYSVKAVHVETGELLWTGSFSKSTGLKGDMLYSCKCEAITYANKAAKDMVKEIIEKVSSKMI